MSLLATTRPTGPGYYNAAHDLIARNLAAGRGPKLAYIDDAGSYTYAALAQRVDRAANALRDLGLGQEDRILVALLDTIDFPSVFLGAIKLGIIPIPVNTLLTPSDYAFMLRDSRAKALIVAAPLLPAFQAAIAASPYVKHVLVAGEAWGDERALTAHMAAAAA